MPGVLFSILADNRNRRALASRLRRSRFELFKRLLEGTPRPLKILDLGGTAEFWESLEFSAQDVEIVLLNLQAESVSSSKFSSIRGDARDLSSFSNKSIDIIYSNSVIEHVGSFADQCQMAREIRRVGRRHFVQTPNYWFPIEPHFVFIGFQYLPFNLRAFLLTQKQLGWFGRERNWEKALELVKSIRLLTKAEVRKLFPESQIYIERFGGVAKSFVAYHGWE